MAEKPTYSIEFKKQVVREYEQGLYGYKKLASMYNLTRDTVRNWCMSARLHDSESKVKPDHIAAEKDLEYYKAAAAYWEEYCHRLEDIIATKGGEAPLQP